MIGEYVDSPKLDSIDVILFIVGVFVVFALLSAAPRMMYFKGLDEKGNTFIRLLPVFVSSLVGHYIPDVYSWFFDINSITSRHSER